MRISSTTALPANWLSSSAQRAAASTVAAAAQSTATISAVTAIDAVHLTQLPAELSDDDATYETLGRIRLTAGQMQAWEQAPNDAVSDLLARNSSSQGTAQRLSGLGSALLAQIGSGNSQYRQTVVNTAAPSTRSQISTQATLAINALQSQPSASVELRVQTQSGSTVTLRLVDQQEGSSGGTGIAAEIQVDGTLSAAEQEAIKALATGFEQALRGLASDETQVDLAQLTQFDSALIARLDLKTQIYGRDSYGARIQKLAATVHADATTREIKLKRPEGEVSMSVDLRQPAFWGSAAQKAKAVDQYLARFDQAATRGHADRGLAQLFKSAFSALTASYGTQAMDNPDSLATEDASWLTGLADFKAQLNATSKVSNPRKRQEVDRFQYNVDQTTTDIQGGAGARTVTQAQDAKLSAAYHQSLFSSGVPYLDDSANSQNYFYKQVDDRSSTEVRLQYDKNGLVAASLTRLVEQSLRIQKFELDKLVDDQTHTSQQPSVTDLLPRLRALKDREAQGEITPEEKAQLLADWNDAVFQA